MSWKTVLLATFAMLMFAGGAQAATVTIDSEGPVTIPYDSAGEIPFSVTVSCEEFIPAGIASGGNLEITVTIADAPTWLNYTDQTLTFSGLTCVTNGGQAITQGGAIPVTASPQAPGMTPAEITLDADGATGSGQLQVEYKAGYSFIVDETFPMEVPAEGTSFPATVHLFGNARSMAMWEVLEEDDCVRVTGVPDFQTVLDDELAGDMEKMIDLTINVTPCSGEWTEAKFEFKTWSHFLDDGAMKTDDQTVTWTFTPAADEGGSEGEEGSPGIGGLLAGLALLGAAFVLRRR